MNRFKAQINIVEATPSELVKASYKYTHRYGGKLRKAGTLIFKSFHHPKHSVYIEFIWGSRGGIKILSTILIDRNKDIVKRLSKSAPVKIYAHATINKFIQEGPQKVYRVEGMYYPLMSDADIPEKGQSVSGVFVSMSLKHQRRNVSFTIEQRAEEVVKYISRKMSLDNIPNHIRYVYATTILAEEYRPPLMGEKDIHQESSDGSEVIVEKGKYVSIRSYDALKIGIKKGFIDKAVVEMATEDEGIPLEVGLSKKDLSFALKNIIKKDGARANVPVPNSIEQEPQMIRDVDEFFKDNGIRRESYVEEIAVKIKKIIFDRKPKADIVLSQVSINNSSLIVPIALYQNKYYASMFFENKITAQYYLGEKVVKAIVRNYDAMIDEMNLWKQSQNSK